MSCNISEAYEYSIAVCRCRRRKHLRWGAKLRDFFQLIFFGMVIQGVSKKRGAKW